ncbi:uncharacterized protein [Gossypium hirsutum]|uniref:Reverse transcriptase domain-containing protein n=1 Tax=Gossypium hirsutum TaxID=3635 RepID=A0ABM3AD15_GOSHI|nr:uncharacterized protein LOC121219133 [Gossypium hirsutum]
MAIKIDLEKAYDRVHWDFIETSLQAVGIPLFLLNAIMSAITTSTMQVLWNGVPTQKFCPARGVRQGCDLILFGQADEYQAKVIKGIPLLHKKVTTNTLWFVVDKVRSKLSDWDVKQLSLSRRVTLAQLILLAIPNYFMQSMTINCQSKEDGSCWMGFGVPI